MVEKAATNHSGFKVLNRQTLEADRVSGVLTFDEDYVKIATEFGILNIEGEGLVIENLNKDDRKILIKGKINGTYYSEEKKKKSSWGRQK